MANLLSDAKKQQVIALGQLGWTLRRIQAATGLRRGTAGAYLKAAGLAVRPAGRWGHPPKPAIEVSTDLAPASAAPPTPSTGPPPASAGTRRQCVRAVLGPDRARRRPGPQRRRDLARSRRRSGLPGPVRQRAALRGPPPRAASTRGAPDHRHGGPAKKVRSTTATARWCATRSPASTAAPGCSSSRSAKAARVCGC